MCWTCFSDINQRHLKKKISPDSHIAAKPIQNGSDNSADAGSAKNIANFVFFSRNIVCCKPHTLKNTLQKHGIRQQFLLLRYSSCQT